MIPNWPWAWPCRNCTTSYKFSVSVKKMGEGWCGGASDIVKAESSGEDPRATGDLVSNLPHPRVNKTKQHVRAMDKGWFSYVRYQGRYWYLVLKPASSLDPFNLLSFFFGYCRPLVQWGCNRCNKRSKLKAWQVTWTPWSCDQGCRYVVTPMLAYMLLPWLDPFAFPSFTVTLTPLYRRQAQCCTPKQKEEELRTQKFNVILRCTKVHPTRWALLVIWHSHLRLAHTDFTCKRGSGGQSEGLLILKSSVWFRLNSEISNSHGFELTTWTLNEGY